LYSCVELTNLLACFQKAAQNVVQQGRSSETDPRFTFHVSRLTFHGSWNRSENATEQRFQQPSEQEIPLSHRKHRHRITCQDLPIGFHHIGFWIHVNVRQRIVQLHIALADSAALLHRSHTFLQTE